MIYYDPQVLADQALYGLVGNWVISRLKKSSWVPFINRQTFWLNKGLAILIATASAIGVEHSYSYTAVEGVFVLTLTGVTWGSIFAHVKQWLIAYAFQQIPYHLATKETYTVAGAK